jgi:hypothetical protein
VIGEGSGGQYMKMRGLSIFAGAGLLTAQMAAQSVLFDFENAAAHSPLPIDVTAGGITASFSSAGQGFSIQPANTIGFTPSGFSGNCIYPSSVFAADLRIRFSQALSDFSILYAPQELACDSSARMRVTAYMSDVFAGTYTTTAATPGTWPSATLAFSSPLGFNYVVIHYDAPPPTGGDYGPIFMADNMRATALVIVTKPSLRVFHTGAGAKVVAWPASALGFTLQQAANLSSKSWTNAAVTVKIVGNENQVIVFPTAGRQFYRLIHP